MGHWEQIGSENLKERARRAALPTWRRTVARIGQYALIVASAAAIVFFAFLAIAPARAGALDQNNPDDILLGDETRQRKLNFETVSGRRLNFADGRSYIFRKDYSAAVVGTGRPEKRGKWSLIAGNAVSIDFENGDEEQIVFITIRGEPHLRYLYRRDSAIQSGGTIGKNILQKEILRIKNVVSAK